MRERALKRFGQHFLHDPAVLDKLIATIAPQAGQAMVEIGGGRGALTQRLVTRVSRLHVIEIDRRLAARLAAEFAGEPGCTIHSADALRFDFFSLAAAGDTLRVAGNLPYNISTPLLFRLLEHRRVIDDMHLMLQKEVAQRITARPGGKQYGRLTVMLAPWTDVRRCFDVGPGAFTPPPRVWSSVVRLRLHEVPRFPIADTRRFASVVAQAFSMRRKTLARAFKGQLSREQIAAAGLDPGARPETLAPEDFGRLADCGNDASAA